MVFKKFLNNTDKKFSKMDYIVIIIITLLYSFMAFYKLGSFDNPETFFKPSYEDSEIIIKLENEEKVRSMRYFTGPDMGRFSLSTSSDGEKYTFIKYLELTEVFSWHDLDIDSTFKYLKIKASNYDGYLGEIQLYDDSNKKIEVESSDSGLLVLDELNTVPDEISYYNSTYFDEIYFARTAYEYAHGMTVYEWVHPPLGKLIQMIPILFLGMNPFSYRLMGVLAGIILVPLMYLFAKEIFKKRKYAVLAALLMAFDNFHYAQSRMGTIDTILVLFIVLAFYFMYRYIKLDRKEKLGKKFLNLFFSGLFMGMAISTKWSGCFGALGLAIIFFIHFIKNTFLNKNKWTNESTKTVLFCILVFVIIPILIYMLSYFLFPNLVPYYIDSFQDLIKQTESVYLYHSTLADSHPFTSPWYSWPLMIKPVWYYTNTIMVGMKGTITGIGNPAVWWGGVLGIIYLISSLIKKKDENALFLVIAILSLWLPYLFIGRVMFLYHYFPVLPFVMLALTAMLKYLTDYLKDDFLLWFYIGLVILLFLAFFPITSGIPFGIDLVDRLKWLPEWYF